MSGAIPPLPNTASWRGAQLQHRDFTFTFKVGRMISDEGYKRIHFESTLMHLDINFIIITLN
jgi:hypothetical protein